MPWQKEIKLAGGPQGCRPVTEEITRLIREGLNGVQGGTATLHLFVTNPNAVLTVSGVVPNPTAVGEKLATTLDVLFPGAEVTGPFTKASVVGPSLHIPIMGKALKLGPWQQIYIIEFRTTGNNSPIPVVCTILIPRLPPASLLTAETQYFQRQRSALFTMNNDQVGQPPGRPKIKYAVIGYGAAAGQFIADLTLQRLILNLINENNVAYDLEVTVYSSREEKDDGAGEAWSSHHDGCINSPIPGHWRPSLPGLAAVGPQLAGAELLTLDHEILVRRVTGLDTDTGDAARESFDELRGRLEAENKPGAALLLSRMEGGAFRTDLPCVPRHLLGKVRANSLQAIVEYANDYIDGLKIEVEHKKWAIVESVANPQKPKVKVRSDGAQAYGEPIEFDKVISFSGSRREPTLTGGALEAAFTGLPNAERVERYLRNKGCGLPIQQKTIGFAGAQLSFIDNITLVGTLRDAFDFTVREGFIPTHCTAKVPPEGPHLNDFIVFSRRNHGSVKPRLSYGMVWPCQPRGHEPPVSYLKSEHILALRTLKGYEWLNIIKDIWKSTIAYRMREHPTQYPDFTGKTMAEEWHYYSEECKKYRRGEPTYCGLERTLISAFFYGYGAEPDLQQAKERMERAYPAVFVSGQRMESAQCAHISTRACVDQFGSNKHALDTLEDWFRTFSSSPVDICEPVFDLARHNILRHVKADGTRGRIDGGNILIGETEVPVDAYFPLTPFASEIDVVLAGVVNQLQTQAQGQPIPVPVWRANGQLVATNGSLVNVWDYGNNRGAGLPYEHANGDTSYIKLRTAVHALIACHEFAPPLAACLLAHDAYTIRQEADDPLPSVSLEDAIKAKWPPRADFNAQMANLRTYYDDAIEQHNYVKSIEAILPLGTWRDCFRRGQTSEGRIQVMEELSQSNDEAKRNVATGYRLKTIPTRVVMNYDEWHGAFADQELSVAWDILLEANQPNVLG